MEAAGAEHTCTGREGKSFHHPVLAMWEKWVDRRKLRSPFKERNAQPSFGRGWEEVKK